MTRPQVIKSTAIFGLVLLVGVLIMERSKPAPPPAQPVPPKAIERQAPTEASAQSAGSNTVQLVQLTPLNAAEVSVQIPTNSWYEQLATIHNLGQIFGKSGEERLQMVQTFVESLSPADLPDAVRALQELQKQDPTESGQVLQSRLLRHWAESDPRAAAAMATVLPEGTDRQQTLANIAGVWAGQNFSQAATWAGQLPNDAERQSALESVTGQAVYNDPQTALQLAAILPSDSTRNDLMTRATEVWAASAPEDAVAWTDQISDETLREQLISGIATAWGSSDPVAAANLAMDLLPAGQFQDAAVVTIVQRWTMTDQAAAQAWVAGFPEGSLQQTAQATIDRVTQRTQPLVVQEAQ